jgi:hypothetical protein
MCQRGDTFIDLSCHVEGGFETGFFCVVAGELGPHLITEFAGFQLADPRGRSGDILPDPYVGDTGQSEVAFDAFG